MIGDFIHCGFFYASGSCRGSFSPSTQWQEIRNELPEYFLILCLSTGIGTALVAEWTGGAAPV